MGSTDRYSPNNKLRKYLGIHFENGKLIGRQKGAVIPAHILLADLASSPDEWDEKLPDVGNYHAVCGNGRDVFSCLCAA